MLFHPLTAPLLDPLSYDRVGGVTLTRAWCGAHDIRRCAFGALLIWTLRGLNGWDRVAHQCFSQQISLKGAVGTWIFFIISGRQRDCAIGFRIGRLNRSSVELLTLQHHIFKDFVSESCLPAAGASCLVSHKSEHAVS
jgi:hypothetical protein